MDTNKNEPEKSDENKPTKIPGVPSRTSSQPRSVTSRICRNITPSISKIPKRDAGNVSANRKTLINVRSIVRPNTRPLSKPIDTKKPSRSTMSLGVTKTTPRSHPLGSSRSNMNTQRSLKSKDPTPRSQVSESLSDKFQKAAQRVAVKKNVLAFEGMKEKVRTYQTELMKKWDVIKTEIPPEEGEFKLIALEKNSELQLLTKTAQKIKIRCPQKTLEQFKNDVREHLENNLNPILDTFGQSKVGDYAKGQECLNAIDGLKTYLRDMLKQIESFESCDKPSEQPTVGMNSDLEVKATKLIKEVDELRKNLEQSQKELIRVKKTAEDEGTSYKKDLEERDKKFAKKQSEFDELKKKLESIDKDGSKEKTTQKELQEKLNSKATEIEDLKKKLKACSQSSVTQQNKNQEHETRIKKLEADLKAALKDVERRAQVEHSIGDQATKHADEMRALRGDLTNFKKENERLEKEIQQLKMEIIKDNELDTQLLIFKDKVKQLDSENLTFRQTIKDLENKLQISESQICVARSANEELSKLKKTESENSQKIHVLEMELTKAHFQNKKLEEKIDMDRKLLKVRCSLIESLQTKESTQKIHLEDLFAEVGERNNDIQMLKTELLTKTEEFQNLFSTLSSKQLELTRQEHMIKLLQESNERAQTLRVRQEAKIGRLEEEVSQLKQTISLYQEAVLPNNVLRNNLLLAEASRDSDCNDNLGYYVDERRRKRHIDISVKKYEK